MPVPVQTDPAHCAPLFLFVYSVVQHYPRSALCNVWSSFTFNCCIKLKTRRSVANWCIKKGVFLKFQIILCKIYLFLILLENMVRIFDLENKRKSSQKSINDIFIFLVLYFSFLNQMKKQPLMITFVFLVFLLFFLKLITHLFSIGMAMKTV